MSVQNSRSNKISRKQWIGFLLVLGGVIIFAASGLFLIRYWLGRYDDGSADETAIANALTFNIFALAIAFPALLTGGLILYFDYRRNKDFKSEVSEELHVYQFISLFITIIVLMIIVDILYGLFVYGKSWQTQLVMILCSGGLVGFGTWAFDRIANRQSDTTKPEEGE